MPDKSWELLHLIFVGIAISYGLFSSRNQEETEKELNPSKFESAQSCISQLLQVSSVFDDEPETQSGSADEITKIKTWSNQYVRNEPVVVLAKEQRPSVVGQKRVSSVVSSSRIGEKPLLLPVRSLKSRVLDYEKEPVDRTSGISSRPCVSRTSSNSDSKRLSGSSNVPIQMKGSQKLGGSEEKAAEKEAAVLPSPIPWRSSRSGRMEVKEQLRSPDSPFSLMGDFNHFWDKPEASKPQISTSTQLNSNPKISPSWKRSSFSSEIQAKTAEDFVMDKAFQNSPPPPPPPLPPVSFKSSSMRICSSSGSHLSGVSLNKDLRKSYSGEQKASRVHSGIEMEPGRILLHGVGKPVRTFRARKDEEVMEYGAEEAEDITLLEKTRKGTNTVSSPSYLKLPEGFVGDLLSESDEDSPASKNDQEAAAGTSKIEEVSPDNIISDGGPDVDKKADEFIAKFREQIRLQRINSIKRSSEEISRSLSK